MALTEDQKIIAIAVDVLASVSKENLALRGELMPRTLVNPYDLRRLADAIEARYPGVIDQTREGDPDDAPADPPR